MTLALIPARGGSKRIPRKNIRDFFGEPMIVHSIKNAQNSGCFERIIVSTDDEEIAAISRDAGAEVPFMRPANLSDDYATTLDVIAHTVEYVEAETGNPLQSLCCIYATAPLLLPNDLIGSQKRFQSSGAKYCYAAGEFSSPVQRGFTIDEQGCPQMLMPEEYNKRSQDLDSVYFDAGQFYWCEGQAVKEKLPVFAPHSVVWKMQGTQVQDIDTQEDWDFAEILYERFVLPQKAQSFYKPTANEESN